MELDTVHCLDWRELLAGIADSSVDAIVSDPPYNTTNLSFETAIDWLMFWNEARRVLATPQSPVILFSQQPFTNTLMVAHTIWYLEQAKRELDYQNLMTEKGWFRYEIIWEKNRALGFLDANRKPLRAHENILIFSEEEANYTPQKEIHNGTRQRKINRVNNRAIHYGQHTATNYIDDGTRYPLSIWKFSNDNHFNIHPTQKPLPLLERLLLTYTQRGDVAVDPFCGSGTTLRAAQILGRRYIGGDNGKDERTGKTWAQIARERLAQPFSMSMFTD